MAIPIHGAILSNNRSIIFYILLLFYGAFINPNHAMFPLKDLEGNGPILDLLRGESATGALVAWHPQARYFAV